MLPAAVIIKHNNPCGVAQDKSLDRRISKPINAIRFPPSAVLLVLTAVWMPKQPRLSSKAVLWNASSPLNLRHEAKGIFSAKKNLRLIVLDVARLQSQSVLISRKYPAGFCCRIKIIARLKPEELKIVSKIKPTKAQMEP